MEPENCKHECRCECHTNHSIMHFMPCCKVCKLCDKNIIDWTEHNEECHNRRIEKGQWVPVNNLPWQLRGI